MAIVFLGSCTPLDLSDGPFRLEDAQSYKDIEILTSIEFDKDTFEINQPVTGKLYFNNSQMFDEVADELGLTWSKTFYYYPNGSMYSSVKIGQAMDTVKFELILDYRKANKERDWYKRVFGGAEAFGIKAQFNNNTHSKDTTFIQYFNPPIRQ